MITVVVRLPAAPASDVARLLRAISRAFPDATVRCGDDCWIVEIGDRE